MRRRIIQSFEESQVEKENSKRNRKKDDAVTLLRGWWAYCLGGDQAHSFSALNLKRLLKFNFSWLGMDELGLGLETHF